MSIGDTDPFLLLQKKLTGTQKSELNSTHSLLSSSAAEVASK